MYTQVTCPNCRTQFTAEIHQVIDAGSNPELKQRLLSGQLNLAICPNCGSGGPMATAMLFHDAEHEVFMVHVPQELNLSHVDREKLIGKLSQQAMDDLPAEQRRAYMLQPKIMLSMQSFMEKVLETEGITPEMIDRQRKQAELLHTLSNADKDVADTLLDERAGEIDETFFAMLQTYIDAAAQANDNGQLLSLTNLRAKLMVETPIGQKLEKQQIALHALSRDAKKSDGLTPQILLQHILANTNDEGIVDALATAGRGALTYSFFSLLTEEIERREQAGDQTRANRLTGIRKRLLATHDSMQKETQRIMENAQTTLQAILVAPDKASAISANMSKIDDAFMYLLMSSITEAERKGDGSAAQALHEIQTIIQKQLESQYPPEVILLNRLIDTNSDDERRRLVTENQNLISADLLKMLEAVMKEIQGSGNVELDDRLGDIKAMIEAQL
jgi:hypothetical protein